MIDLAGDADFFDELEEIGDLIAWVTGAYLWELAVPILLGTLTRGALAAAAARGQVFGSDLGAV